MFHFGEVEGFNTQCWILVPERLPFSGTFHTFHKLLTNFVHCVCSKRRGTSQNIEVVARVSWSLLMQVQFGDFRGLRLFKRTGNFPKIEVFVRVAWGGLEQLQFDEFCGIGRGASVRNEGCGAIAG